MFDDRSAYPHPDEFKVVRPEYSDPDDEGDDVIAIIEIAPFKVLGYSATRPGARRAALYEAAKKYRSYHPGYRVESPFPSEFEDEDGQAWKRVPSGQRDALGDYLFTDADGEEDSADLEQMLLWDVRPVPVFEDDEDDDE